MLALKSSSSLLLLQSVPERKHECQTPTSKREATNLDYMIKMQVASLSEENTEGWRSSSHLHHLHKITPGIVSGFSINNTGVNQHRIRPRLKHTIITLSNLPGSQSLHYFTNSPNHYPLGFRNPKSAWGFNIIMMFMSTISLLAFKITIFTQMTPRFLAPVPLSNCFGFWSNEITGQPQKSGQRNKNKINNKK